MKFQKERKRSQSRSLGSTWERVKEICRLNCTRSRLFKILILATFVFQLYLFVTVLLLWTQWLALGTLLYPQALLPLLSTYLTYVGSLYSFQTGVQALFDAAVEKISAEFEAILQG